MLNPKLIMIAAVIGFVLSFISGLIAGAAAGALLLRAVFSAAVSGGITAGVSVLYKKFLEQPADSFSAGSENLTPPGSVVDITLGDDDLRDDDAGPGFYVDPLAQKKTVSASQSNSVESAPDREERSASSSPDDAAQQISAEQEKPAQTAEENAESESGTMQNRSVGKGSLDDELDELPDITALSREITSSDDAVGSDMNYSNVHVEHNTQDATLMAQAIRTILTKDG